MSPQESPTKLLRHDGRLALEFAKRGNKTVMTNWYQSPPLKASRALYINSANPSEATVYMMESSGGLMEGDENTYQIDINENADVCLIPQSATVVYPAYKGLWSSQKINVSIGSNASLAWKTESLIPFKEAMFRGNTVIQMEKDSTLLWGEILSPGRDKRGERFEYNDVKTNFQVWMDGECLIYDPLLFSPDKTNLEQMGLLEDHLYVGSLWLVAPNLKQMDIRALNERLQQYTEIKAGVALIEEKAINVRWLASDSVLLKQEMNKTWQEFSDFLTEAH